MRRLRRLAWLAGLTAVIACGSEPGRGPTGIETALEQGPDVFFEQAVVGPQDDGTWVVATTQRIDPAGDAVEFPGRPTRPSGASARSRWDCTRAAWR